MLCYLIKGYLSDIDAVVVINSLEDNEDVSEALLCRFIICIYGVRYVAETQFALQT